MRTMCKWTAAVAMVLAIAAVAAPVASAQSVEVTDEAHAGAHCPTLAAGGCTSHLASTGNVELRAHVFGVESHVTTCQIELQLRADEDGNGRLENQSLTGAACTRQPCGYPVTLPWPAVLSEPTPGQKRMTISMCFEPIGGGTDTTCELEVPIRSVGDHDYEFGNVGGTEMPCHGTEGFRGEIVAHWRTEANSTLELIHL